MERICPVVALGADCTICYSIYRYTSWTDVGEEPHQRHYRSKSRSHRTVKSTEVAEAVPVAKEVGTVNNAPEQLTQATATRITSGCEIVSAYDWDYRTAYAVCMAESGGNANAANTNDRHNGCIGSYGLMQIACIHTGKVAEYNPERNVAKAYEIYSRSGWKPWGAYTSGAYLRFM